MILHFMYKNIHVHTNLAIKGLFASSLKRRYEIFFSRDTLALRNCLSDIMLTCLQYAIFCDLFTLDKNVMFS